MCILKIYGRSVIVFMRIQLILKILDFMLGFLKQRIVLSLSAWFCNNFVLTEGAHQTRDVFTLVDMFFQIVVPVVPNR